MPGGTSIAQVANFGASVLSGCDPLVVNFIDSSTGTVTSYNWNLGNSTTSTLQNPSTTYSTPGTYTVSLTVNGPGGSNTLTKTAYITVYDKPAITITATSPLAGCTPHSVQFSSTVTANSPGTPTYSWDFGDGNTGTGTNPGHTYTYPGTYPVSLTVTNGMGCTRTVTRTSYITSYAVPVGGFTAAQTAFCSIPSTALFTSTSFGGTTPYSIGWDFGDGGKGSGNAPSHVYTTGGGFTVTMIVNDANGCADTVIAPGYISVNATTPTFTAPANICVAAEGTFTNTTTGVAGTSWDFDDGTFGTGTSVTHVYASSGTYTVKMTTNISGCQKTVTKTVIVHPKPSPMISQSPSIPCPAPVTVTFSGSSSTTPIANYSWIWYNGGTATGQTVSKNYTPKPLGYEEDTLKLIATTAMGCMDSIIVDTVFIRDIITGAGSNAAKGCIGDQFEFSESLWTQVPTSVKGQKPYPYPGTFYPNSWSWDFGDGSQSNEERPIHEFRQQGTFTVRLTVSDSTGRKNTKSATITVE